MKPKIAFLGTGFMGAPMAANLIRAGYPLAAWNRSPGKTGALADLGATVAETPVDAVRGADVVYTMLANGSVVADLLFGQGVAGALTVGALVIDSSSIKPAEARAHAARLSEVGIGHLDAPVSGGPSGAEAATLAIMAGGEPEVFARGEAVLACLGRPIHVGPAGAGQLAKLANQIIVALAIGAVAEGLLLAGSGGADPAAVRQAMTGGFADSLVLQIHGERMIDRRFLPGASVSMHLKDLENILATAAECGLDLPLTKQIHALFDSLVARGGADYDHSAVLLEIEHRNGAARLGDKADVLPD